MELSCHAFLNVLLPHDVIIWKPQECPSWWDMPIPKKKKMPEIPRSTSATGIFNKSALNRNFSVVPNYPRQGFPSKSVSY